MAARTIHDLAAPAPDGGNLVTTSGFCAACDSYFIDAAAYLFDALDGSVLVEARHYSDLDEAMSRARMGCSDAEHLRTPR